MPFINIKITRAKEPITEKQKAALIKGVTDLLAREINRGPATTVVIIDEVDTDNYGIGGETISARRKKGF